MRSAQVQLIGAFEGHEVGRYDKFCRASQIFPRLGRILIEQFGIAGVARVWLP